MQFRHELDCQPCLEPRPHTAFPSAWRCSSTRFLGDLILLGLSRPSDCVWTPFPILRQPTYKQIYLSKDCSAEKNNSNQNK